MSPGSSHISDSSPSVVTTLRSQKKLKRKSLSRELKQIARISPLPLINIKLHKDKVKNEYKLLRLYTLIEKKSVAIPDDFDRIYKPALLELYNRRCNENIMVRWTSLPDPPP